MIIAEADGMNRDFATEEKEKRGFWTGDLRGNPQAAGACYPLT